MAKEMIGRVFGRLTVIECAGRYDKRGILLWKCICECGNYTTVIGTSLRNGNTKSCSCISKELAKARVGDKNQMYGVRGKEASNWKGGVTSENRLIRTSSDYSFWRKAVLEKYSFTCQKCYSVGGKIVVHHIENFATNKALRTDLNNGICLCTSCHLDFHKLYGKTNNNSTQLSEYFT